MENKIEIVKVKENETLLFERIKVKENFAVGNIQINFEILKIISKQALNQVWSDNKPWELVRCN